MTITLLTAVPRTGKTSYAVWDIIKPAIEEGKTVYVCGIPKLQLPHIKVDHAWIRKWHERKYSESIEEDQLEHIPPNSLVVLDEAWECWPAAGIANAHESISHLAKHGHYGIDFLIITQKPHLLHTAVLAQVSVHKHILKKWSGAKMLEWPEYVANPSVKSNRDQAVTVPFKVRSEAFSLYHSGQFHTKLKQRKPLQLYFALFIFALMPVIFYYAYSSISSRSNGVLPESIAQDDPVQAEPIPALFTPEPLPVPLPPVITAPIKPTQFESIVSADYDWSGVSACLSSKNYGCVCYGKSGHRLAVPADMCESAITYGWPQNPKKT